MIWDLEKVWDLEILGVGTAKGRRILTIFSFLESSKYFQPEYLVYFLQIWLVDFFVKICAKTVNANLCFVRHQMSPIHPGFGSKNIGK